METKRRRQALAWLTVLCMLLTALPVSALAGYGPDGTDYGQQDPPSVEEETALGLDEAEGQAPSSVEETPEEAPAPADPVASKEAWLAKGGPDLTAVLAAEEDGSEGAETYEDAPVLTEGTPVDVSYDGTAASGALRFTPSVDGTYVFWSTGTVDTWVEVRDAAGTSLGTNDDGGEGTNFLIRLDLTAGTDYLVLSRLLSSSSSGKYSVAVTREKPVVSVSLALTGGPLVIGDASSGYWGSHYDDETGENVRRFYFYDSAVRSVVTVTATYEDGTSGTLPSTTSSSWEYDRSAWTAGSENTVTVRVGDASASVEVKAIGFADQYADAPVLTEGTPVDVSYDGTAASGALRFTPSRDGAYSFTGSSESYLDTWADLRDMDGVSLGTADGGGENGHFKISAALESGKTYVLLSRTYSSSASGEYSVTVVREPDVTEISLAPTESDPLVIGDTSKGYWSSRYDADLEETVPYFQFNDSAVRALVSVAVQYEDGTSETLPASSPRLTWEYDCSTWTASGGGQITVSSGDVSASVTIPLIPFSALYEDSPAMELDVPLPISYSGSAARSGAATFTPEEDGAYWFSSEGEIDTRAVLYDANGTILADADDYGASLAFAIEQELTAGTTYVLDTRTYGGEDAEYAVKVSRDRPASAAGYDELAALDLSGKLMDLIFVVDTTGSMGDEIASVRDTLNEFVDAIAETGARLRISLIDYKDIVEDFGREATTVVHARSDGSYWFENDDLDDLHEQIAALRATGGGNTPESVVDALGKLVTTDMADGFAFNANAAKFAFLLTDADYREENSRGIEDMAELIGLLNAVVARGDGETEGVAVSVVTEKQYFNTYRDLAESTGGALINLRGEFSAAMAGFAARIAAAAADYVEEEGVVRVERIEFAEDLSVPVGRIKSFTATVYPSDATNKNIQWSVADPGVSQIGDGTTSERLVVQGVTAGETRITARSWDGGYVDSFVLTVTGTSHTTEESVETCDADALAESAADADAPDDLIWYNDLDTTVRTILEELQARIYEAIAGTDKTVTFTFDDDDGDLRYSWGFRGADIDDASVSVDMEIEDGSTVPGLADAADAMERLSAEYAPIRFHHTGALPGEASVSVAVDLPDGAYSLFLFDDARGELIRSVPVAVRDGVAVFAISELSLPALPGGGASLSGDDDGIAALIGRLTELLAAGDLNGDGVVTIPEIAQIIVARNLGGTLEERILLAADLNGDGVVTIPEIARIIVARNMGTTVDRRD